MAYQIIWTTKADNRLKNILHYLVSQFSHADAERFLDNVSEKLHLISSVVVSHRRSQKHKHLYYPIIRKRTLLIYRIKSRSGTIEILDLWDARQDPKIFGY